MSKTDDIKHGFMVATFIFLSVFLIALGILSVDGCEDAKVLRKHAIEQGFAQHNPTTGKFEWINKDKEATK